MKEIKLKLFGGRIECVKTLLKNEIKKIENSSAWSHDLANIYKSMLEEIINQKNEQKS